VNGIARIGKTPRSELTPGVVRYAEICSNWVVEYPTPVPTRATIDGDSKLTGADRVLATLKELAKFPNGASLDEIAQALDAPKSSVHRALATLRRANLARQDRRGRYQLGLELIRLAYTYHERLDEPALVQPVLEELAEQFGETAHYAKLMSPEIVYLGKVTAPGQRLQLTSVIGGRNPAHATAAGKALLALALPDDGAVERFVAEHGPLDARTEQTNTTAATLVGELARTRERGYALDREESELGIVCIAFPVFLGSATTPTGAVSLTALRSRMSLEALVAAADDISGCIRSHLGALSVH
jgi:IclR family transcriptional regulator, acetate operon repressor